MRATQLALMVAGALALAVVLAFLLLGSGPPVNITMCGTGKSGSNSLLYSYGVEKGIFEKYGLNVTFVSFRDVYTMMLAFFSGKVTTISISPGLAASSYNNGEKLKIGMAVGRGSDHHLLAQPGITELDQLRGKKLGVHGRTSDNYNIMKWYMESKGIDIESDLEVVEISSPANLVTLFQTHQVDAVVLWGGYAVSVMVSGGIPLVQVSQAAQELTGYPYYMPLQAFREDSIQQDEANIKAFLRAMREISREVQKNKEEAARIWSEFSGQPYEAALDVVDLYVLLGDLDEEAQQGIMAFFDYGAEKGYFERAPGEEIFYASWR